MNTEMPELNRRLLEIINFVSNGNVSIFVSKVGLGHQVVNRCLNIDKRNGKYPQPSTDIITAIADKLESINISWLLTGSGEMLKTGDITNTVTGDNNTTQSSIGGGHNVSISGDAKAKKIIEKDKVVIELEQSAELYKQKAESLETRIRDLESLLKAKEEIIELYKNK